MKKPNSNRLNQIENELISRIIKESKKTKTNEWDQQVTLNAMPDDIAEEDVDEGNEFSGELEKARKAGKKSFVVNGKKYPVKEGLYDVEDINPKNRFDYTEEEGFMDVDKLIEKLDSEIGESKLTNKQKYIAKQAEPKDKIGSNDFKVLRNKKKGQVSEGNAFGMALKNARDNGDSSFELNGKTYEVKEGNSNKKKKDNKWIQDAINKPGALKKKMNVGKDEKIPSGKLKSKSAELKKKSEGDKELSKSDLKTSKQVNLALNLKKMNESKIYLSEDEIVNLIEKLVAEEAIKGLDVTNKNLKASKKENDDYLRSVTKKMKDYLKDASKGDYETNPKHFPDTNGKLGKMKTVAYRNTDAADEFIDNFAYGNGMEALNYDEIHPNEEWMKDTIEGSERTGNSPKYANAVETDVNKKKNTVRKDRLYQINKEKVSYNRQEQPVKTKDMGGVNKVDKIFRQLESDVERNNLIKEEFNKIQHLMGYNKKTQ